MAGGHTLLRAALQVFLETEEHLKIEKSIFFFLCLWELGVSYH